MLTKDSPLSSQHHLQATSRREEAGFPWSSSFLAPSLPKFPLVNLPFHHHHHPRQMDQNHDLYDNPFSKSLVTTIKKESSPEQHHDNQHSESYAYKEVLVKQEPGSKEAGFDSLKKMMQRFGPSGLPDYQAFDPNNAFDQQHNDYHTSQQQKLYLSQQQKLFHYQKLHLKRSLWSEESLPPLAYNPLASHVNPMSFQKSSETFYNDKKFNFSSNIPKPPGFKNESFKQTEERLSPDEGAKLFPCRNCSFISSSKEEFEQHSRKHFKFSCSMCNYKSKSEGRLKRHLKHSHENQCDNGEDAVHLGESIDAAKKNSESFRYSLTEEGSNDGKSFEATNEKSLETSDSRSAADVQKVSDSERKSCDETSFGSNSHNTPTKIKDLCASDGNSSKSASELPPLISIFPEASGDLNNVKQETSYDNTRVSNEDTMVRPVEKASYTNEQSGNKKLTKARVCKICGYVTYDKNDNYQHRATHFPNMLKCDVVGCKFATQHRHHFLYHMKGHKGDKSYKCTKCNYSCLTRSMLVSHEKCHSYVYRYRCNTCKFSAKHAHALTVHIVKWNHEPAPVLRPDGSLPINDPSSNFENFVRKGRRNKQVIKNQETQNSELSPVKKNLEKGFGQFSQMYNNTSGSSTLPNVQSSAYYQNLIAHRNMLMNMNFSKAPPIPRNFLNFPFTPSANSHFHPFNAAQQGLSVKCPQCQKSFESPLLYMNHAFTGQCTKTPTVRQERFATPDESDSEDNRSSPSNHLNHSFHSNDETEQEVEREKKENGSVVELERKFLQNSSTDNGSGLSNGKKACAALDLSAKTSSINEQTDDVEPFEAENTNMQLDDDCLFEETGSCKIENETGNKNVEMEVSSPPPLILCSDISVVGRKSRRKGIAHKLQVNNATDVAELSIGVGDLKEENEVEKELLNKSVLICKDYKTLRSKYEIRREIKTEFEDRFHSQKNIPLKEFQASEESLQQPEDSKNLSVKTNGLKDFANGQSSPISPVNGASKRQMTDDKTFHCRHCQIVFGDKRIYDIHMQFHKPGDPFSCQLCSRQYSDGKEFFLHVAQFEHKLML